jgi:hypothetical protein
VWSELPSESDSIGPGSDASRNLIPRKIIPAEISFVFYHHGRVSDPMGYQTSLDLIQIDMGSEKITLHWET